MEQQYGLLKRDTLKDLLEARGCAASGKNKATLIADLMEGDQAREQAMEPAAGAHELTEVQRDIQWRLALLGPNPPLEVINQVIADTNRLHVELQRGRGELVPVERPQRKKLPYSAFRVFQDGQEEIDRYLQVFETQCDLQGVGEEDWVTILVSKLSGRALDAFETVPAEERRDYDRVKERLLARYDITPEAHRIKFRSLRKKEGQPHTEWVHQMARSVEAWLAGCQATTLEDVTQLILLEQFYEQLPVELRDWVRDRNPLTADKAASLADQYVDARRTNRLESRAVPRPPPPAPVSLAIPPAPVSHPQPTNPCPRHSEPASRPPLVQGPRRTGIRCYRCHRIGHIRQNCPRNNNSTSANWSRAPGGTERPAAHCIEEEDLGVLHEVDPVNAAGLDNRHHHRQTVSVNGCTGQGLRDSGATITLVQPHMVSQAEHTGKGIAVRVAGGKVLKIPTARVYMDWGAGARDVEVGVMKNLPADVLLGNDLGKLISSFLTDSSSEAYPVTTRRQAQQVQPTLIDGTQMPLLLDWQQC